MVISTNLSWASVVQGGKRQSSQHQGGPSRNQKKGQYVPSYEWKKFAMSAKWQQDVARVLPKSAVPHGIRIDFGGNPHTFQAAALASQTAFPGAVSVHQHVKNPFFDLGFQTKEEADAASKVPFEFEAVKKKG